MGNGLRVRARLTTMPEKKNGTAMHTASSAHVHIAVTESLTVGTSVICTSRHKAVVKAKAVLK
jgi:hypothetical protein